MLWKIIQLVRFTKENILKYSFQNENNDERIFTLFKTVNIEFIQDIQ